MANELINMLTH